MANESTGFWIGIASLAAVGGMIMWWQSSPPQIVVDAQRKRTPIQIKGRRVAFEMEGGRIHTLPPSYGMIHDPTGKFFPKCHVFFGPYQRTETPVSKTSLETAYYGSNYPGKEARLELPRGPWRIVGNVVQIFYWRPGRHEGAYFHPFATQTQRPLQLAQSGRFYRLSLPESCVVNERGFVWP